MFKFIHAADIHLDSPLKGLEQYEGAPVQEIRVATRRALGNLVDLAIENKVAFVLISGDLYDGNWRDYNTGLFFVNQARRLREAGIPLYIISGNHDAANRMTRTLQLPDNVTFFSADAPETALIPELEVAIHGQGFATAAVYDDLSLDYPAAKSGWVNIGMLHTCVSGREGHDPYAPCTIDGLKAKGYDYWALGHIHIREILSDDPIIAFSGNIQGRHAKETGPKGCLLVTVHDDRSLTPEFRPLDVLRWALAKLDVSACQGIDELMDLVSAEIESLQGQVGDRLLALRIELSGQTELHRELHSQKEHLTNEIRSRAIDIGRGDVWVEKVKLRTSYPTTKKTASSISNDAIGELNALFEQVQADTSLLGELNFDLGDVAKKLPAELKELARPDDPEWIREILEEAQPFLLSRLSATEDEQ